MPVGECRRALVRLAVRPICDAAQRTAVRLGFSRNGGHRVPIGPLCPVGSQCGHANISTEWRTRLAARRIAWVSASGKHIGGGAAQVLAQLDKAELYASAVAAARCSTFGHSFAVLPPTPSARLALLLLPRRLLRASASMRVSARRVLRTIPAISLGRRSVWRCVCSCMLPHSTTTKITSRRIRLQQTTIGTILCTALRDCLGCVRRGMPRGMLGRVVPRRVSHGATPRGTLLSSHAMWHACNACASLRSPAGLSLSKMHTAERVLYLASRSHSMLRATCCRLRRGEQHAWINNGDEE